MLIEPNNDGWSVSSHGPWQLIYNDQYIIKLIETDSFISTQEKLFVGTKEECNAKVQELDLPLVSRDALESVEDNNVIVIPLPPEDKV